MGEPDSGSRGEGTSEPTAGATAFDPTSDPWARPVASASSGRDAGSPAPADPTGPTYEPSSQQSPVPGFAPPDFGSPEPQTYEPPTYAEPATGGTSGQSAGWAPSSGQQQYGPPSAQSPYGSPDPGQQYGQPDYGAPQYPSGPYGQPPYGQYGQSPYGPGPYGGPAGGYGASGYPGGYAFAPVQTSGRATTVLVLGIASLPLLVMCGVGIIPAIVALAMSGAAKREIDSSAGRLTGLGMVRAGRILSWIAVGLFIVGVLLVGVGVASRNSSGNGYSGF
jgi:hypothetical protein